MVDRKKLKRATELEAESYLLSTIASQHQTSDTKSASATKASDALSLFKQATSSAPANLPQPENASVAYHAPLAIDVVTPHLPTDFDPLALRAAALQQAQALADAYRRLRLIIGVIAVSFPAVLIVGGIIFQCLNPDRGCEIGLKPFSATAKHPTPLPTTCNRLHLQDSLSAYYYTPMRNYFVGALCALAVFFISYSFRRARNTHPGLKHSVAASIFALGVAFDPTTPSFGFISSGARVLSVVHKGSAVALFVVLAYFSLVIFPRPERFQVIRNVEADARSETRFRDRAAVRAVLDFFLAVVSKLYDDSDGQSEAVRRTYRICGLVMSGVLLSEAVFAQLDLKSSPWRYHLLVVEFIALVSFGISWLVKSTDKRRFT